MLLWLPAREEALPVRFGPLGLVLLSHLKIKLPVAGGLSAFPQECWGLSTDEFPFLLPSRNAESVSPAALLATTMLTRRGAGSVRPTVSPASAATVISAYPVNMATFWMKKPAAALLSARMGRTRIPVSCFPVLRFWKRQSFYLSNSMHGIWTLLSTKQNLASWSKSYFRSIV